MATITLVRPAQAAKQAGISPSSLRNYTNNPFYRQFFSSDAAPPPGSPRLLSPDDVKLLRFIAEQTAQGKPHEEIAAQIAAGALGAYDWQPPEEPATAAPEAEAEAGQDQQQRAIALQAFVSLQAQNQDLVAGLIELTRDIAMLTGRLQAAEEENERLRAQLSDREELARLRAELAEAQAKKGLWARLLGK